jgi:AcrR family transcriptional regulator
MPKIVDHDERRRELLEAVVRVIARDGIEGATTRALARETGWSTGALAHYFSDKNDILTSALEHSHERITSRWKRELDGLHGIAALRRLLLDIVPLDDERRAESRLEIVFWSQALNDDRMRDIQRREAGYLYGRVAALLGEARDRNEVRSGLAVHLCTERLMAVVDGLSLHALLYPDRVSAADVALLIDEEIDRLTAETP